EILQLLTRLATRRGRALMKTSPIPIRSFSCSNPSWPPEGWFPCSLDVLGRKPWGEAHVGGSAGHLRVLPPARRSSRAALQTATHPNRMAPGSMERLAEQEKSD